MARRSTTRSNPLTLGFAGSGQLDRKAVDALLDDYVDGATVETIIVPATLDDYTDEIVAVVAWAKKRGIAYVVLSSEDEVKDRALKKLIADASEDYAITTSGLATDMAELLKGSEDEPVLDGRMLLFLDPSIKEDIAFAEAADELEIPAIDLCSGCEVITLRDEEETEPEPQKPAPAPARRGRGGGAAAAEPEPEELDDVEGDPDDDVDAYSESEEAEFETMTTENSLPMLKKALKAMDRTISTEDLKNTDKAYVADLIILTRRRGDEEPAQEPQEAPDEAQASPAPARGRRGSQSSVEPADGPPELEQDGDDAVDQAADSREAVFARLRSSKETADRIAFGIVTSLRAIAAEGEQGQELERAAGAVAASLMLFAEHIITEVRKTKSAGRPRKDGTEAKPKPPVDPDVPRRRPGRPRKDGS